METTYKLFRETYTGYVSQYSEYAFIVFRIGLGAVIFLAGAHKLLSPDVWTKYFAPWFAAIWPTSFISLDILTLAEGVFEILLGTALLAGWYTTLIAGLWALIMISIIVNLATIAVINGKFVDILIRDVGLFTLALGLTLLSAKRTDESR
jgi:uncharacterized membrane protein YphA (DoxX/SURF4 family)